MNKAKEIADSIGEVLAFKSSGTRVGLSDLETSIQPWHIVGGEVDVTDDSSSADGMDTALHFLKLHHGDYKRAIKDLETTTEKFPRKKTALRILKFNLTQMEAEGLEKFYKHPGALRIKGRSGKYEHE